MGEERWATDAVRTEVDLISEHADPILVIGGLDRQADGGTHIPSAGEVGRVRVATIGGEGRAFEGMRVRLARE